MIKLFAAQVRREHATDWPGIRSAVGVSTDVAKHRTDVQTSATAYAVEHFALFGVGHEFAAAVVHQHDVKFFRAISLARPPWSADQCAVSRNGLPGTRGREHRPQYGQVFQFGNHLLNSRDSNVYARHAGGEASIAFVGVDGDHATVRHQKVRGGDSHLSGEECLSQFAARSRYQFLRIFRQVRLIEFFAKQLRDLLAVKVHGRRDDVIRRLVAKLHNVFAQVGLPDFDSHFFERRSEMDLLRDHGLGLDYGFDVVSRRQIGDVSAGLLTIFGPKDGSAVRVHVRLI